MSSPSLINQVFKELDQIAHEYLDNVADKIRTEGLEIEMIIKRGSPALLMAKERALEEGVEIRTLIRKGIGREEIINAII